MAESMEVLKGELRRAQVERRAEKKSKELMSRRGVKFVDGDEFVKIEEVKPLAEKLKKKGTTDVDDLIKLQKAFLQGENFVSEFLSVSGAFAGLIRDVSGSRPIHALRAAFCLCNLSVNTKSLSWRQTKAVAPYLMIHLDGVNSQMLDACAWTVGNLSLVDEQSWQILHDLGTIPKLAKLLKHPKDAVLMSAVYSLTHFAQNMLEKFSDDELKLIAGSISAQTLAKCDASRLTFLLSTTGICDIILSSEPVVKSAVQKLHCHLAESDLQVIDTLSEVTFLLRYLANTASTCPLSARVVLNALAETQIVVLTDNFPHLKSDFCWLMANLLKHPCEEIRHSASQIFLGSQLIF